MIYIREAHPDSVVTVVKDGKRLLEKVSQTSDLPERKERARQFCDAMRVTMPTLVDRNDDAVNKNYAAWPERLYVIGVDGKIAYKGGQGPGGFRVAALETWLASNAPSR